MRSAVFIKGKKKKKKNPQKTPTKLPVNSELSHWRMTARLNKNDKTHKPETS